MKILILNSILYTADNNVVPKVDSIKDCMIYNFALGFVKSGHGVTLVAAEEYKPVKQEQYDFEVIFLKSNIPSVFKVSLLPLHFSLWAFLKKRKNEYDLVISSESFSFSSLFASLIMPSKLIIWHELFAHNKLYFRMPSLIWYNTVARFFYRNVCIIPRSEKARLFISNYGRKVTEFVEHGINTDTLINFEEKKDQFVVVAQLIQRKRIDHIIRHFSSFLKKYPANSHFKLIIVGRGEMEEALKALAAELGVENNVHFSGFISHKELFPIVSQSRALLVDTEKDLNMVSIPEAIAVGTPVLTNTQPGSAYYIKRNDLGIVKDGWNEDELDTIVKENDYYSANCRNYKDELSNTSIARKMIQLFDRFKK